VVDRIEPYPGLPQAVLDRVAREAGVVLFPREALFLDRGRDPAVFDESRSAVVIERRDTEDADGLCLCSQKSV
jgi:hypothetical protein